MPLEAVGPGDGARRTHRSVYRSLLITMIGFGAVVGFLFPPFAAVVLHTGAALTVRFFLMCVAAGLFVGGANYVLFKVVVSRELRRVVDGMQHVNDAVQVAEDTGDGCRDSCRLEVTSDDLIGRVAESFNRMTEAIALRITRESRVRQLLQDLSETVEIDAVAGGILTAMAKACGARAGVLYGLASTQEHELLSSFGVDAGEGLPACIDKSQGLAAHALSTGETAVICPERDGLDWMCLSTPLGSLRPRWVVLAPLMAKHRPVGLAVLACPSTEMSKSQIALVEAIRVQAAAHLQTAILHRKLRDLAAVDDLTHILNRRFGMRRLSEEFSRSLRHGVPLSVLMLDVDNFKSFNDTFGHDAGDAVLMAVARVLEGGVRSGDVVCRYGGEELLIVAPGMGLADAASAGERFRRLVESTSVEWGGKSLRVTVSVGVTSWPVMRASTPEELVSAADKALYFAKEAGRNQVALSQGNEVIPLSALVTKKT